MLALRLANVTRFPGAPHFLTLTKNFLSMLLELILPLPTLTTVLNTAYAFVPTLHINIIENNITVT